ncbi:MAG: hypothetical protein PHN79_02055 [Methanoregula sp.]|nr:hypothetical protein [Methanoregula sp.]
MTRYRNDVGLSEVIGFILLLGLVAAAFSMWMVYVVPVNGREAEIIQMDGVKDRFTDYKISLDSLWINNQSYVTVSTSFNLGTGGGNTQASGLFLPMLNPIASSAVIAIQDTRESMNITYRSAAVNTTTSRQYLMNSLQYQSQNYYWIQQQYEYQDGGVFLSQENRTICRVSPPISFVNNTDYNTTVDITPIQIAGGGSIGGNGPVRVDSRLRAMQTPQTQKTFWVNISVNVTDYSTALMWRGIFDDARRNGGITNTSWYSIGITPPSVTPGRAFINISGPYAGFQREDVSMTVRPVEYSVFLNNIAPMTF